MRALSRYGPIQGVLGAAALLWACNVQPGGGGEAAPSPAPKLAPERAASGTVRTARSPSPEQGVQRQPIRRMAPIPRVRPTGPMAKAPAPLPQDGTRIAIFHAGNVEGELDPCG